MSTVRHAAAVVAGYTLLFSWLFSRTLFGGEYPAESDLYEYFLPVFLSPLTIWSVFEFGGAPAFADPGEPTASLPFLLFSKVVGSWTAYIVSAYVIAASGAYAYVFSITRSRLAAVCAGLIYGLSEALIERVAHLGTVHTIAWFPLMVLAIDRLRGDTWARWIPLGALICASAFFGGNPQTFLYGGYAAALYGLVGGIAERAGWRYWAAAAATAVLGGLITTVKSLPMLEAAEYTARQVIGFGQFLSFANTPAQMLSIVVPAIVHEEREAPTYVGLATLVFALAALAIVRRNWRVGFWAIVVVVCLMLGMGDATPLAALAYEVPFYDKFRVVVRHLYLAAFGFTALAGIGIAAARHGQLRRGPIVLGLAIVMLAVGATAAAVVVRPDLFELDPIGGFPWRLPIWGPTVWGQLILAALTTLSVLAFAWRPQRAAAACAMTAVLALDLLFGTSYIVDARGFNYTTIPGDAVEPGVHAAALRDRLQAGQQRLLSPAGTHVDDVAPAAFARLWQLPIAGGYGPMLMDHYAQLGMIGTNGAVEPVVLADANRALDVMAVRYLVMQRAELDAPGEFIERDGVRWSAQPMSLPVGPWECGQQHPRQASYALPPDVRVAAVLLNLRLQCSEDVPQGTEVGAIEIRGMGGGVTVPLRAGIEVAEEALDDPAVRRRARHEPATVFDDTVSPYSYVMRIDLPGPLTGATLGFTISTAGSMAIDRITVVDEAGQMLPQSMPHVFLNDASRWRQVETFATSRITDRGRDVDAPREREYVVFENLRARPRAWLVSERRPTTSAEADLALHHSLLPDGSRFDPGSTALVDANVPAARWDTGESAVRVMSVEDSRISVRVSSEGGGFLVLSETYYPGWHATVDGTAAEVRRTNVAQQGVEVPPGVHVVDFTFASPTLAMGRAVSGGALAVTLLLLAWSQRRRSAVNHPAAVHESGAGS